VRVTYIPLPVISSSAIRLETLFSRGHSLPNHLDGLEEQGRRDGEAQGLGSLEVDDQLERHGLLDGEVARRGAFEDFVDAPLHLLPQLSHSPHHTAFRSISA
jgi:hypothetical protein